MLPKIATFRDGLLAEAANDMGELKQLDVGGGIPARAMG